jgi:hypothetical protein
VTETTIHAERSCVVRVDPEKAWSLLGSAAVWSLRPGFFVFDVAVPDVAPRRCLLWASTTNVAHGLLEYCSGQPGVVATWRGGPAEVTFSASRHRRGSVVGIAMKNVPQASDLRDQRKRQDRMLGVWLAAACLVLEGQQPWPSAMPGAVRRACAARRLAGVTRSGSASVLIPALLSVVWDAVTAPPPPHGQLVASGHVPGTPTQEAGEMQYFVQRAADGQLVASTVFVHDFAYRSSAATHAVQAPHEELAYLLTAEGDGTRLEITATGPESSTAGEPEGRQNRALEVADSFKTVIEGSGRPA